MLLKHVPGLFIKPENEWKTIRGKKTSVKEVYLTLVLLLAAIPPLCGYIGTTMVGWQIADGPVVQLTDRSAIKISILFYLAILISIYAIGRMIHWMGETYGFNRTVARCVQLAAFTVTPLMLIGVFLLFSEIWVIYLIGLPALVYSVYLLYTGVPIMLDVPRDKGFLLSSAVLAVGLVALVGMLGATVILWSMGIAPGFEN